MGIGKFAQVALRWIGRLVGFVQTPLGRRFAGDIFGEVFAKKMPKYLGWLDWLENNAGAHTELWSRVVQAKKDRAPALTLSQSEIEYLFTFKKGWDKFLKKPLNNIADDLKLDTRIGDVVSGIEEGEDMAEAFLEAPDEVGEPAE